MTLVLHRSDVGEDIREPATLASRRRRLSTIATRRIKGRPCLVSVHRKGSVLTPCDETVRLRRHWKDTLIGPNDVVVFTYLPLGGAMGGSAGGGSKGKGIGMAVAMIAVAVAAPYLVGALAPAVGLGGVFGTTAGLTLAGKILAAGIVAGAGYFLSKATKAKANKSEESRPLYGVAGGGNLPRAGDRIPINYGRVWSQPDLSQPDYFIYQGNDQVLFKRMTVGGGDYQFHTVRVGQAVLWDEDHGLRPPFQSAQIEVINPGALSSLVPGAVYSSDNVAGIELPRPGDTTDWSGPFPVTEPGVETTRIQLDWSLPQGVFQTHPKKSGQLPATWGVVFDYAKIDDDGNIVGTRKQLYITGENLRLSTQALRYTHFVDVPKGRYVVWARNTVAKISGPLEEAGVTQTNTVMWDGLRAHLFNEPPRPGVTEIALKVSAEALGNSMTFSDIWVETTCKLPVLVGSSFVKKPTRKAVWAALDILRNTVYGGAYPDSKIDFDIFQHYDLTLSKNDTFDGTIRGPVSVYEAASTVLGVIRAEPVLIGDTWSLVRDEPRQYQKHVISRRQIVKDSSGAEFDLDMSSGDSDVIVEYYVGGDPKRRSEVRATIGAETLTPKRMQLFGVSDHEHAIGLARWYAASAFYRRETRLLTTELVGRIMGRNDPAMIETWFMDTTQAAGVVNRNAYELTLDIDFTLPVTPHVVLRDEKGQEWGPVAITAGVNPRTIVLDTDDVAVIAAMTGRSLSSLFTKTNRRLPLTVLIGSLSALSRPYIIRTARPDGAHKMQISAVYDAPEVWSVLGETVPPAPPIKQVLLDEADLAPILPYVRGNVVQKATALVLDWTLGKARGCQLYQVWIAYGTDGEWVRISNGPATEGSHTVRFKKDDDTSLRIRARAVNTKGIPSDWMYTTATLFRPFLNDEIADMLIELKHLQEQVRKDIASIAKIGEGTIRGNLKKLQDKVDELANAAATEAGTSYEARNLIKVAIGGAMAAIQEETRVRVTEDEALAQQITTLLARMGTAEAAIQTEVTARVTADTALASQISTLSTKVNDNSAAITIEATARAAADSAQASQISVLQTTVGGHTSTLTQYGTSIDGIKAQYGVSITIDGQTGGFVLSGIRQLDGSVAFSFGIRGNLIVDGTIFGTKLAASNIITASAQIGSAVIDNAHIKNLAVDNLKISDGAVSTTRGATSSTTTAQVSVNVRSGSSVIIFAIYRGSPDIGRGLNASANIVVRRNGSPIETLTLSWAAFYNSTTGTNTYGYLATPIIKVDAPGSGTMIYQVEATYPGVSIVVMELSK